MCTHTHTRTHAFVVVVVVGIMSFFDSAQMLGAVGPQLSAVAGASTSQMNVGGPASLGQGTGMYGMQRQATNLLGAAPGQTAMGFGQRTEEGQGEQDNQTQAHLKRGWGKFSSPRVSSELITGVPLFVCNAREALHREAMQSSYFPLWAVNQELEDSAISNLKHQAVLRGQPIATSTLAYDGTHLKPEGRKRARVLRKVHTDAITPQHAGPDYDPSNASDQNELEGVFSHNWSFTGLFYKVHADALKTQLIINIAIGRHTSMPNYWGDVKVGDGVGFMLKWVEPGYYSCYYDETGQDAGPVTPMPFLQLVPYVAHGGVAPLSMTAPNRGAPRATDLDSTVPTVTAQTMHELAADGNGLPTTRISRRPEDALRLLQHDRYDFGKFVYVGCVTKTRVTPDADVCKRALRSPSATAELAAERFRIDVLIGTRV